MSDVTAGSGGFIINGSASNDRIGQVMACIGDVNGDGLSDVGIGAGQNGFSGAQSGRGFVVFGKSSTTAVNLTGVAAGGGGGFAINAAAAGDYLGPISGAGDVNGDGLSDLIIGAPNSDPNGLYSGRAYVVFGKATTTAVNLTTLQTAAGGGFCINGHIFDGIAGSVVTSVGDINGDGLDDVALMGRASAVNRAWVVFGKSDFAAVPLSGVNTGTGGFLIQGNAFNLGDICGAGDVNGDGLGDLLFGQPRYGSYAGGVWVVFGKADTSIVQVTNINSGTGGFRIAAEFTDDYLGQRVSGLGDLNGDGLSDIYVSAHSFSAPGESGRAYVVFGKSTNSQLSLSTIVGGSGGYPIRNGGGAGGYGAVVAASGAGDIDGDGVGDILMRRSFGPGEALVIDGKATTSQQFVSTLGTGAGAFRIIGESSYDSAANTVRAAGDVDGDGDMDTLVGAPTFGGATVGRVYVVFNNETQGSSSLYRTNAATGNAPAVRPGELGAGTLPADSRVSIDFTGGSGPGLNGSSAVDVTVYRTDSIVTRLGIPYSRVANRVWRITTNRTGSTNAQMIFNYSNTDIAGMSEPSLVLYKAPDIDGPWTQLAATLSPASNRFTTTTTAPGVYAIVEPSSTPTCMISSGGTFQSQDHALYHVDFSEPISAGTLQLSDFSVTGTLAPDARIGILNSSANPNYDIIVPLGDINANGTIGLELTGLVRDMSSVDVPVPVVGPTFNIVNYPKGDVNKDGVVDLADVALLADFNLGLVTLP